MKLIWIFLAAWAALLLCLLLSRPANAQAWTDEQRIAAGVAMTLHALDWAQTRSIARSNSTPDLGSGFVEKGPVARHVIGEAPSRGQVDAYMIGTGALTLAIAHLFPEYRMEILTGFGIAKLGIVVHNHAIGVRIGGSF